MGWCARVEYECHCPQCGILLTDFQTKQDVRGGSSLLKPWEVNYFYGGCNSCQIWLDFSFDRAIPDPEPPPEPPDWKQHLITQRQTFGEKFGGTFKHG